MEDFGGASRRGRLLPLAVVLGLILAVSVFGCSVLVGASDRAQGGYSAVKTHDPFAGRPGEGAFAASEALAASTPERDGALAVKWSVPQPDTSWAQSLVGRWVTEGALYPGTKNGLVRHAAEDGAARNIPLPDADAQLVGMSTMANGSAGVIAWIGAGRLNVSVIDLATDRVRFSAPMPNVLVSTSMSVYLAANGSAVVAAVGDSVGAFDIQDGRTLWTWSTQVLGPRSTARISGVLVDDRTVLLSAEVPGESAGVGISLSVVGGTKTWDAVVTADPIWTVSVVNIDPPTFFTVSQDDRQRTLVVTDERGGQGHVISAEPGEPVLTGLETADAGDPTHRLPLLIVDGVFYTRAEFGADGRGVTAVDLRTGEAKWRTPLPTPAGDTGTTTYLHMAGSAPGAVFVLATDDYEASRGVVVWRLSTGDGAWTKHVAGPNLAQEFGSTAGLWFTWSGRDVYAIGATSRYRALRIGI